MSCACLWARSITSRAYAPSSDCSLCQISVSSAKLHYAARVCVFTATRHIILPLMSRNMLFPADSLGNTNTLSIPSSLSLSHHARAHAPAPRLSLSSASFNGGSITKWGHRAGPRVTDMGAISLVDSLPGFPFCPPPPPPPPPRLFLAMTDLLISAVLRSHRPT